MKKAVVIYSGGTDSTCVASLLAEEFDEIHLLTFFESGTANSPQPSENIRRLRLHYPKVKFINQFISTDHIVRKLYSQNFFSNLLRHQFISLCGPGLSSLSWQIRTIIYCKENNIDLVADGVTQEWLHFPGHMDSVLNQYKDLYTSYGIDYQNPVREWPVPPDRQMIEGMIVNQHDYLFPFEEDLIDLKHTTGKHLYDIGFFDHPNIKGSKKDRGMQHDCFPFILYNIMAFWIYINIEGYEKFSQRIDRFMKEKIDFAKTLISQSGHLND